MTPTPPFPRHDTPPYTMHILTLECGSRASAILSPQPRATTNPTRNPFRYQENPTLRLCTMHIPVNDTNRPHTVCDALISSSLLLPNNLLTLYAIAGHFPRVKHYHLTRRVCATSSLMFTRTATSLVRAFPVGRVLSRRKAFRFSRLGFPDSPKRWCLPSRLILGAIVTTASRTKG